MKHAIIERNYKDNQTLGKLEVYDEDTGNLLWSCVTLELPWKDNKVRESCILEGDHIVKKRYGYQSGNFDYTHYIIQDVEGRTYILFHIANFTEDLLGCIGVGQDFKWSASQNEYYITDSEATLEAMINVLGDEFILTIEEMDRREKQ